MSDTNSTHRTYQSYLLRLWRDDTRKPWRASLQSAATEQLIHFADIESLFAFLEAQTQTASSQKLDFPKVLKDEKSDF